MASKGNIDSGVPLCPMIFSTLRISFFPLRWLPALELLCISSRRDLAKRLKNDLLAKSGTSDVAIT